MKTRERAPHRGQLVAGKYQLVARAGEGGMAVVWQAIMRGAAGFTRPVALKQMKPELAGQARQVAMFVEEARLGSQLSHPNVAQVVDFVEDRDGTYWLVTEWVDGLDMGTLLRSFRTRHERMPWAMVTLVGVGALRGLAAAHDRVAPDGKPAPVIHRDVSPPNILLGVAGAVKLSDFGLARARDRANVLTTPGFVKGRVAYLSPERVGGAPATVQSDIFSMGAVLWEALAGRPLFSGKGDREIMKKIHDGDMPSVTDLRPSLPRLLVEAVHRALAPKAADRYPAAADMAQDLETVLAGAVSTGLDAQLRLGRAVADARRQMGIGVDDPDEESRDRVVVSTSRIDIRRDEDDGFE